MYTPVSTYRIQFHKEFTLQHLLGILPYLHQLGITTIYASPIFKAVPGSNHGYDGLEPFLLNSEIGTEAELLEICSRLKEYSMTWVQDIVPNHMAYRLENEWVCDVWEKGDQSFYYKCFDIQWDNERYPNRVMIPWLDTTLVETVEQQQIRVHYGETGFSIVYQDKTLPMHYYQHLEWMKELLHPWEKEQSLEGEVYRRLQALHKQPPLDKVAWRELKGSFAQMVYRNARLREAVHTRINSVNESAASLLSVLEEQHYVLCPWNETDTYINYRRFFTINDLICLRIEDRDVFDLYHTYIHHWVKAKVFQGVRIDHIDGLADPKTYLDRLRTLLGEDTYIVVEKILEPNENSPDDWEAAGTTGYDFLSYVNRLFVNDEAAPVLSEFYESLHVHATDYEETVFRKKLFILIHHMGGELQNLTDRLAAFFPDAREDDKSNFRQALAYWLVSFPVYRLYIDTASLSDSNARMLQHVLQNARQRAPQLEDTFDQLRPYLCPEGAEVTLSTLDFLRRTQQFTGPLMAKGVEDTTFYTYNRLISQNEVGDTPDHTANINVASFHKAMRQRSPITMNTTATHDTKRGEDARMRINLLSEFTDEWMQQVAQWHQIAQPYFAQQGEWIVPDPNDEYFIYQSLIGTMPLTEEPENHPYHTRLKNYLTKAMREAKVHTNWAKPDAFYEDNTIGFAEKLLADETWQTAFQPFCEKIARYGVWASLAQLVLKGMAPGIPDTYQGTEDWDLSMVDPDNRRPVDYPFRQHLLAEAIAKDTSEGRKALIENPLHPAVKMYTLYKLLHIRKQYPSVCLQGDYVPLLAESQYRDKVLAFSRTAGPDELVVVVPIRAAGLCAPAQVPLGHEVWKEGFVYLPHEENSTYTNLLTGESIQATPTLLLAEVFRSFPVAILHRQRPG